MKAGWKTTEFWLSLAAMVIGALLASGAIESAPVLKMLGTGASVLAGLGYTATRGFVKSAESNRNAAAKIAAMKLGNPTG